MQQFSVSYTLTIILQELKAISIILTIAQLMSFLCNERRSKKRTTLARFELTLPRELDFKSNAITTPLIFVSLWYYAF
jgi:hypothetical protein